jgi:hypothetical protein
VTVDVSWLGQLWSAASARPVVSSFRTAEIGVSTVEGPVLAAIDSGGRRHLLVPLAARQTLRQDVTGRAVHLRPRTLEDESSYRRYASLELVDERQSDLFAALCVEVVDRIQGAPDRAVAALRRTLGDWRALLAGNREVLTPAALAGLFGELQLLEAVIDRDAGSIDVWTGPTGSAQDFHHGLRAVEVKSTVAAEGRVIRIHGADQLDVSPPGELVLQWMRLRTDRGRTVPEVVDELLARVDDAATLNALLSRLGYHHADRELYTRQQFEVIEKRTYVIGNGFPRIVPAALSGDAVLGGVGPIEYTVDLDAASAEAHRTHRDPAQFLLENQ